MPNYSNAELNHGAQGLYSQIIATYGIKYSFKILRQVKLKLKAERTRRLKLPPSERGIDDTDEKPEIKSKAQARKTKPKSKGMFTSLCELFEEMGVNTTTYEQAKACAKEAKPDSDLSKGHFKWYKKRFINEVQGAVEVRDERTKKPRAKKKTKKVKRTKVRRRK